MILAGQIIRYTEIKNQKQGQEVCFRSHNQVGRALSSGSDSQCRFDDVNEFANRKLSRE